MRYITLRQLKTLMKAGKICPSSVSTFEDLFGDRAAVTKRNADRWQEAWGMSVHHYAEEILSGRRLAYYHRIIDKAIKAVYNKIGSQPAHSTDGFNCPACVWEEQKTKLLDKDGLFVRAYNYETPAEKARRKARRKNKRK